MKKYYIVRYDDGTPERVRKTTLPEAVTAAEALARENPGRTVCVFQIKQAMRVDTVPVVSVDLEN